jgi:hypothetical protein
MAVRPGRLLPVPLALGALLVLVPGPAAGYIDFPPPTLGALCERSANIHVLRVEKVNAQKGVILFTCVEVLKGKPDFTAAKHVVAPKLDGAKIIFDWAAEGKTAVLFTITGPGYTPGLPGSGAAHACIDGYWYSLVYESNGAGKCWIATRGTPGLLTRYSGPADQLRQAVAEILRGKEVVVPCLVNDRKEDVAKRTARVQRLRASLDRKDYDVKRDFVGWGVREP